MKKVLVVNIGTEIGGIEKCLINFLRYLDTRDCQVDLLLWKPAGPLYVQIPKSVHVLDRPGPGSLKEICKLKPLKEKIVKLCTYISYKRWKQKGQPWKALPNLKEQYDIAISYCQNGHSPYYVLDNVNAEKKYMFYHHGSYEKDKLSYEYDKITYPRFDKIITVSQANKEMLLKYFPDLKSRFEVIHNLIDEDSIIEKANEPIVCFENLDALKIATVGRLSTEKGQQFALQVALQLKKRGVSFEWVFVGDGPEREADVQFAMQNDLLDCCHFVGAKENPYPYIKQADIYVQTSFVEADPTTIHEAKVLRKRIIASDIPAIREAVEGLEFAKTLKLNVDIFARWIECMPNINDCSYVEKGVINVRTIEKLDHIFDL